MNHLEPFVINIQYQYMQFLVDCNCPKNLNGVRKYFKIYINVLACITNVLTKINAISKYLHIFKNKFVQFENSISEVTT